MDFKMLASVGIIGLILLGVKYMLGRAKSDTILAELKLGDRRKQAEEFAKDIAKAEQEVLNAKIAYDNARRNIPNKPDSSG